MPELRSGVRVCSWGHRGTTEILRSVSVLTIFCWLTTGSRLDLGQERWATNVSGFPTRRLGGTHASRGTWTGVRLRGDDAESGSWAVSARPGGFPMKFVVVAALLAMSAPGDTDHSLSVIQFKQCGSGCVLRCAHSRYGRYRRDKCNCICPRVDPRFKQPNVRRPVIRR